MQKNQQFRTRIRKLYFDYMIFHCDLELEDSKPTFLHNTLAHDDASPYHVWLQKVQQLRKISSRQTFTEILSLSCETDRDRDRAIQSFHKWIGSAVLKIYYKVIFWLYVPSLWLCPWRHKPIFWKTIWPMMMHPHTKFGSKRFSDSEDIVWTNVYWHFEILLWPWRWIQQFNFFIRHSGLW